MRGKHTDYITYYLSLPQRLLGYIACLPTSDSGTISPDQNLLHLPAVQSSFVSGVAVFLLTYFSNKRSFLHIRKLEVESRKTENIFSI